MKQSTIIALTAAFAVTLLGAGQYSQAGDGTKIKKSSKGKTASKSTGEVRYAVRGTGAETGLAGINIYDSGLKVLRVYGNPESISAISVSSGSSTGGGQSGPPGGFGGPGGGGTQNGPKNPGGGGAGAAAAELFPGELTGDADKWIPVQDRQRGAPSAPDAAPPGGDSGQGQRGGGRLGPGAGAPGGAPGAGGNTAAEETTFTRWQYTKNGTKLAFVIDKFNRVLQIEAIGLVNKNISTKRGVGFGNTFQTVMNKYAPANEPDGYDLAGNNFTIRFLTRSRVAFRLTQLGGKTPHVVTGIVVSAGKK